MARDVRFVRSDIGMFLVDPTGAPHRGGFLERGPYGPGAAQFRPYRKAELAIDAAGRRYPIGEAAGLAQGDPKSGDYYLLGHIDKRFGHLLLEGMSRAWGLEWALARGATILAWGAVNLLGELLGELLDLRPDRIAVPQLGVPYERVYLPDRGLRLLGTVNPVMGGLWQRMADRALAAAPDHTPESRFLYLSRAGVANRALDNEADLEAELRDRGGLVVRPETLAFADQVRLAARARTIVGCAGSQLHLSMFARPGARKLVIGSEEFLGPDEMLISIANDTVIDHYVQRIDTPAKDPMRSAWSLDLAKFLPAFDRWLDEETGEAAPIP